MDFISTHACGYLDSIHFPLPSPALFSGADLATQGPHLFSAPPWYSAWDAGGWEPDD